MTDRSLQNPTKHTDQKMNALAAISMQYAIYLIKDIIMSFLQNPSDAVDFLGG